MTESSEIAKRVTPLLNRILVQKILRPATTAMGIILPKTIGAKLNEGKVVAVGSGLKDADGKFIPMSLKVGDHVLMPEYGGTVVRSLTDDEFHILNEDEILAKIASK